MEFGIIGIAVGIAFLIARGKDAKNREAEADAKAAPKPQPVEPLGPVIYDEGKEPYSGRDAQPGEGVRQSSGQVVFAGSPVHLSGRPSHLSLEHRLPPHLPPLLVKGHPGIGGNAARQQLDAAIPALRAAGLTEMQIVETSTMLIKEATRPKEQLYRRVYEQAFLDTPLDRAQMRTLVDPIQVSASALQVQQRRAWGLS